MKTDVLKELPQKTDITIHVELSKEEQAFYEAFREIMEELLENKHKVLIFSQFIDHLSIIKNYLEKENISYQYLDGKTPTKERAK